MTKEFLNYFKMLKENANNEKVFLKDNVFVQMMHELNQNKNLIMELGLLDNYNHAILSSINTNRTQNLIINSNNIKEILKDEDIIKIVEFLTQNGICIIIEPNNNIYLDIDYTLVKHTIIKSVSTDAIYAILLHEKVQNFAVVDNQGRLSQDIYKFKDEVIISCDFQKNATIFPYYCEALDFIDLSIAVYKK